VLRGSHIDVKEPPPSQMSLLLSNAAAASPAADARPLQLYRKAGLSNPNQWKLSAVTKAVTQFGGRNPPPTNPSPLAICLELFSLVAEWEEASGSTLYFGKGRYVSEVLDGC